MAKHKKKQKIRIYFKDGKKDIIPQKYWDNYDYIDHLFVVIKKEQWIAVYNMDIVACIGVG
jgi:hypothetical protein